MVYVAVELLMTIRLQLVGFCEKAQLGEDIEQSGFKYPEQITDFSKKLSVDTQGTVIYRGLDRWSREGTTLYPRTSTDESGLARSNPLAVTKKEVKQ